MAKSLVPTRFHRLIVVAGVLIAWLSTSRLWVFQEIMHGHSESGYFENRDGRIGLALYPAQPDDFLHAAGLDARGRVSIPPGSAVALPIGDPVAYRVSADEGFPYVVVGSAVGDAGPRADYQSRWLVGAHAFTAEAGGIADPVAWNPGLPWRSDEGRLESLRAACGAGAGRVEVLLSRIGEEATLAAGNCSKHFPIHAESGGELVMVVVAGPSWSFVQRIDGPLPTRRVWYRGLSAGLLIALGVVPLGLGWPASVVTDTAVVIAASINPGAGAICAWIPCIIAIGALAVRLARRRFVIGLAIVLAYFALRADHTPSVDRADKRVDGSGCILSGYSAAAGVGVIAGGGVFEELQACDTCNQSAGRYAKSSGATFELIEDLVCNDRMPLLRGGNLVFLGAANDDLISPGTSGQFVNIFWRVLFHARETFSRLPGIESFKRFVDSASRHTLRAKEVQRQQLQSALRCARDRHIEFVYVHDMLVIDMPRGREPARRELLALRRETVESGGGVFIDVEATFEDRMGVSWFSDPIHLSSVGQRAVGRYVCERMGRGSPGTDAAN